MKMQMPDNNILAVWQPLGISTHKLAVDVMDYFGVKATHTGTLDPMAEGVVILLLNQLRYKKQEMTSWLKTYEFDVILGVSTDSYDGMGFITDSSLDYKYLYTKSDIEEKIGSLLGPYQQEVPLYSAIKYKGKKLFKYARSAEFIDEMPKKSGYINNISLTGVSDHNFKAVMNGVFEKLLIVKGDFRQQDIVDHWTGYLKTVNPDITVTVLHLSVTLTRGLYVRSLSQDICHLLNIPGFVSKLTRIKNGEYGKDECVNYDKLFQ